MFSIKLRFSKEIKSKSTLRTTVVLLAVKVSTKNFIYLLLSQSDQSSLLDDRQSWVKTAELNQCSSWYIQSYKGLSGTVKVEVQVKWNCDICLCRHEAAATAGAFIAAVALVAKYNVGSFSACFDLNDEMLELAAVKMALTFLQFALIRKKPFSKHFYQLNISDILPIRQSPFQQYYKDSIADCLCINRLEIRALKAESTISPTSFFDYNSGKNIRKAIIRHHRNATAPATQSRTSNVRSTSSMAPLWNVKANKDHSKLMLIATAGSEVTPHCCY